MVDVWGLGELVMDYCSWYFGICVVDCFEWSVVLVGVDWSLIVDRFEVCLLRMFVVLFVFLCGLVL